MQPNVFQQVVLQSHQTRNKPEYIHKMAKEKLEQEGKLISEEPKAKKKRPSSGVRSVSPMDMSVPSTPLPDLPPELQQRQDAMGTTQTKLLAPPAKPAPSPPTRGQTHTDAPSVSKQVKRKYKVKALVYRTNEKVLLFTSYIKTHTFCPWCI